MLMADTYEKEGNLLVVKTTIPERTKEFRYNRKALETQKTMHQNQITVLQNSLAKIDALLAECDTLGVTLVPEDEPVIQET